MKPVWPSWPAIRRRLMSKKNILVLLDLDGTIVPIASRPKDARLDPRTKKILSMMTASDHIRLCVISGRSVRDLRSILGIRKLHYIGNHGFEIRIPGIPSSKIPVSPTKIIKYLATAAKRFRAGSRSFLGAIFENKGHTLSLHYKNITQKDLKAFRKYCQDIRRELKALPLIWRRGKKVLEILPDVRWNKGSAALLICDRFPDRIPVALGDDRTDEDMFRALKRRGITVRVGRSKRSAAEYYLESQRQVKAFLLKILESRE